MQLTDWLGEDGVWFHINSDHHVMALIDKRAAHFHHLAFDVVDIGQMRVALDHLGRHGRWLGWGPTRHGVGGNIASYVRIVEEECFVELYCDMEQLQPDHEPRRWPDDRYSSNTWGPLPPRSYFRFDQAAIDSERESLEMLGTPLPPRARKGGRMTLQGYTVPRTPSGRASLVPSPPWHYVGDFIVVDFHADPEAAASLLPEGLEPHPDAGRCAAVFADWQSFSEGGDELTDPVRSQYREFYIVVSGVLDGEPVTTCPFIWVNQDFAMARGWIQGYPKKLGDVWMTRSFDLDCKASPGDRAGARFGATCSARGRELARATLTLEQESESGSVHTDPPLVNVRHFPRLAAGQHDDPRCTSWCAPAAGTAASRRSGRARRRSSSSAAPGEEHTLLDARDVVRGYRFTFAYTVDDLRPSGSTCDERHARAELRDGRRP